MEAAGIPTVKACHSRHLGIKTLEAGLPQGTALRNAWKHRLTAVQLGIAEADVTIIIIQAEPSSK